MLRLLSLSNFRDFQNQRYIQYYYTALFHIDGKVYSGSRSLEYLCTVVHKNYVKIILHLSSSGQSFWLQIQRSRVRSPALPDFLSSSGSGTGSTQPREVN